MHFQFLIFLVIIFNTIFLAMDDYPTYKVSQNLKFRGGGNDHLTPEMFLIRANQALAYFFLVEMLLKLIALHPKNYFKDGYNCFDAFVVLISIIDIVLFNIFE
jgi:hypothetical protein